MSACGATGTPIRAVFFDLGNVLLPFDFGRAARKLAARTGRPETELTWTVATVVEKTQYEYGRCDSETFRRAVLGAVGLETSREEFRQIWGDIFWENPEMVEFARALRGKVHRHILSNTNELHIEYIRESFPFFLEFDGYTYSYLEGVGKPHPQIYRIALARAGVAPAHSLFIDDRLENVLAARQLGMQAVHYADRDAAMKEIRQCLPLP